MEFVNDFGGIIMEQQARQSIKRESVADKMKESIDKYPRDKFIWVNSPLETAGDWPEHYGLGARVFKVPTDNIVQTTSRTGKVTKSNGWIFELHGKWLLLKPSKLQLMHDAGVVFALDQMKRIDDGSDPNVCEMKGAAGMLSITGLVSVTGRKRIDLRINKNVPREYLIENTETKLELRLGWKLLGIPQAYTMEELQTKQFVTFCIYSAPHATNQAERMLILQHHLGIYGAAFGTKELPQGIEVKMIEAGPDDSIDAEEMLNGSPIQEAEFEPVENGSKEEKPQTTDNFEFLKQMRELKIKLIERNVKKAEQSKEEEAGSNQGQSGATVEDEKKEDSSYQFLLDVRRKAFEKMSQFKLKAEIESLSQEYDFIQDPLNLMSIMSKENVSKLDMVEVAIKLVEHSIIREAIKKSQGGRS